MNPKRKLKVLVAAGGSGGHLFPAQQLKDNLIDDSEIFFAGHRLSQSPFFNKDESAYQEIVSAPFKRGFFWAACKGFWQSILLIRYFSPDVIVGFGSYHTFPLLLAAVILRKKLILFEANSTLGRVNRFFYPFSTTTAFQFISPKKKGVLVPFLPWSRSSTKKTSVTEARDYFGLDQKTTTLLVFGGSQGASFLNQNIPPIIEKLKGEFQVIHLKGKGAQDVFYKQKACIKEFETDMLMAYAASDCMICRSGAGTIAEIIQYQVPALLIPFPSASEDHQQKNGEFLIKETRAACLLSQKDADPDTLLSEMKFLLENLDLFRLRLKKYYLENRKRVDLSVLVRSIGRGDS